MSDATEPKPASAKNTEVHPLDALTGGAFSAATSGERGARLREWLLSNPSQEQLQEVFKELGSRDKSASRLVRERLDEMRRAQNQELISKEWEAKAIALLASNMFSAQDAQAWQRDAAKAGAGLSREPLAGLKAALGERVRVIEDIQHRIQVQRETAVLLAQRIEVLSTKSWKDAQTALELLKADMQRWHVEADALINDPNWTGVDAKFPPLFDASRQQLTVVWEAFQAALAMAVAADADVEAPLPSVPVWADELRVGRGEFSQAVNSQEAAQVAVARQRSGRADPGAVVEAEKMVMQALEALRHQLPSGKGPMLENAVADLRAMLKSYGRYVSDGVEHQVHAVLLEAGESEGWQRRQADKVREELVQKAEALLQRPDGQVLGGRRIQETLRQLRDQWKLADQSSAPNHALWKRFDEACNSAHKVVEAWLEKVRAESAQNRAQRLQLIEELRAWSGEAASRQDWKALLRGLQQFADRWRNAGHLSEKAYGEMQAQWKQAMALAAAPLEAVQKESLQRRHSMIEEAAQLAAAMPLRIDAIKALQSRWQSEAQSIPMDRRQEQKLWDTFRKPLDEAFERKGAERKSLSTVALTDHERAVVSASQAVEAAVANGDTNEIRQAVAALDTVLQQQNTQVAPIEPSAAASEAANSDLAAPVEAATKPVVAVRGDDRPGSIKQTPPAAARGVRPQDRKTASKGNVRSYGAERERVPARGPRLGDTAFRAQRDAQEKAQQALRKLAAKAHGESLVQLMTAWEKRDPDLLPATQELGQKLSSNARAAWGRAIGAQPAVASNERMLRLEIAAEVPTPAAQLSDRRLLQLQLLTRRHDAAPSATWVEDVAAVLSGPRDEDTARRLQNVLKVLMK